MFTVYDLRCDGLRDPKGISGRPTLSWRVGSDRTRARQTWWRVLVTSAETGRCLWDSGVVATDDCAVTYAGAPLEPGEVCVWCVEAGADKSEQATSVPAAFFCAETGSVPTSEAGPACESILWTSSERLNEELGREAEGATLPKASERLWHEVLGVRASEHDANSFVITPQLERGLAFVQGSRLEPRGLLVVRWERESGTSDASAPALVRLEVTLAPGMSATLVLADDTRELCSGHHVLTGVTLP
ncbi:MAG: alpha-L-rhamnosidase C-terminal domain-containing protein [Coriobacteriales bacterium]|nr:alpha-L-rhamnosidase C-terminal domain-containing protein [Coriobacteriales bacterium]